MAKDYAKNRKKYSSRPVPDKAPIPAWFWLLTGLVVGFLAGGLLYLKNLRHSEPNINNEKLVDSSTESKKNHMLVHTQNEKTKVNTGNKPHFDFYTMLPKMEVGNGKSIAKTDTGPNAQDVNPLEVNTQSNTAAPTQNKPINNTNSASSALPQKVVPELQFNHIDPAQNAINHVTANPQETNPNKQEPNSPSTVLDSKKTAKNNLNENAKATKEAVLSSEDKHEDVFNAPKKFLVIIKKPLTQDQSDELKAQLLLSGYDVKLEPIHLMDQDLNRVILGPFDSKVEAQQARKALEQHHYVGEIKGIESHKDIP